MNKIPEDAPELVAYRVGELEKRFDLFEAKLDRMASNFATVSYVDRAVEQMRAERDKSIKAVEKRMSAFDKTLSKINWLVISSVIIALLSLVLKKAIVG